MQDADDQTPTTEEALRPPPGPRHEQHEESVHGTSESGGDREGASRRLSSKKGTSKGSLIKRSRSKMRTPNGAHSAEQWLAMGVERRRSLARAAAEKNNTHELLSLTAAYMGSMAMSAGAQTNHRSRIKHALHDLRRRGVKVLEPGMDMGEQYIIVLAGEGRAFNTIRAHTSSLRILYEALAWARVMRHDPFFGMNISIAVTSPENAKAPDGRRRPSREAGEADEDTGQDPDQNPDQDA